jgi:acyl-CoA thioester hydrolase
MSAMFESYRGAVYPWHCDHMGHMNVMWYVGKFDEGTWNLFQRIGLTPAFLRNAKRGMAAAQQRIAYRRELVPGDTVVVSTGLLEVRDKAIRFVHEMRHQGTGEVAAITELTAVHTDATTRKAIRLPEAVASAARESIVDYDVQSLFR